MQEYIFIRKSPFSGKINEMTMRVKWEDHEAWKSGVPIQTAMPYLTADEREFLISGLMPDEWEEAFGRG